MESRKNAGKSSLELLKEENPNEYDKKQRLMAKKIKKMVTHVK